LELDIHHLTEDIFSKGEPKDATLKS
jgi:hypothetical protein